MKKQFLQVLTAFLLITPFFKAKAQQKVTFILDSSTNLGNPTVTIPITVKGFYHILAFQGSLQYNDSVLTYKSFQNVASVLGTGQLKVNPSVSGKTGRLAYLWTDPNSVPEDIADDSVLFSVTFNVVSGAVGQFGILFTDVPTKRKVVDSNLTAISNVTYTPSIVVLPISFAQFTGATSSRGVDLTWVTATESNTDYFVIQKSTDGKNFTDAGTVSAVGNSSTLEHYSFSDKVPATFYRIETIDKNGNATFSDIVTISTNVINSIQLSPNPSRHFVNIKGSNLTHFYVYDLTGKLLLEKSLNNGSTSTINIESLSKGEYAVKVKDAKGSISVQKLVVE